LSCPSARIILCPSKDRSLCSFGQGNFVCGYRLVEKYPNYLKNVFNDLDHIAPSQPKCTGKRNVTLSPSQRREADLRATTQITGRVLTAEKIFLMNPQLKRC